MTPPTGHGTTSQLTAVPPPDALGGRLRALRHERAWSLVYLSDRCGIAASTLSKVENNQLSLTYDRLQAVATALDLSLSAFLASPSSTSTAQRPPARISWARHGDGTALATARYAYRYVCDDLQAKAMVPIVVQCHARTLEEFGEMSRHPGEEFILVLQGRIEVRTEFHRPQTLDQGEGVYVDSAMGHAYLNAAEGDSWLLSICHHRG